MKTELLLLTFSALNNLKAWSCGVGVIMILSFIAYVITEIMFRVGIAEYKKGTDLRAEIEEEAKQVLPSLKKLVLSLVLATTLLTIIPDERQMIAIYIIPKLEAGAVEFGKTWGNLPPKLASLMEAKLDKALKETLGDPDDNSIKVTAGDKDPTHHIREKN